jgi:hypothetical protein
MSKLKLLLAMVVLALLSGCNRNKAGPPDAGVKQGKLGGGVDAMDAPIVVSDDLYVRHAHNKKSLTADFQGVQGVTAASDSGKAIQHIRCENMKLVGPPPASYPDCMGPDNKGMDYAVANGGGQWILDIYDKSGSRLVTLTPAASMPPCNSPTTYCQVVVTSYSNVLHSTQDDGKSNGSDSDTGGGTEMAVYDTNYNLKAFTSAILTDVSKGTTANMSCLGAAAHDCKIRIKYQ